MGPRLRGDDTQVEISIDYWHPLIQLSFPRRRESKTTLNKHYYVCILASGKHRTP